MTLITINMTLFLEICTGIGIICATGVWIRKLLKPLTKPLEDIKKEVSNHANFLDRDKKEISLLKDQNAVNTKTIHLLLEVNHRLICTNLRPYHSDLYRIISMSFPQPIS